MFLNLTSVIEILWVLLFPDLLLEWSLFCEMDNMVVACLYREYGRNYCRLAYNYTIVSITIRDTARADN